MFSKSNNASSASELTDDTVRAFKYSKEIIDMDCELSYKQITEFFIPAYKVGFNDSYCFRANKAETNGQDLPMEDVLLSKTLVDQIIRYLELKEQADQAMSMFKSSQEYQNLTAGKPKSISLSR